MINFNHIILLSLLSLTTFLQAKESNCENARNTYEVNICGEKQLSQAKVLLEKYFLAAKSNTKHDKLLVQLIEQSQSQWEKYQKSHCNAIYQMWSEGTIRGVMYNDCMLTTTKSRTYEIWAAYLNAMDSSIPILAEP